MFIEEIYLSTKQLELCRSRHDFSSRIAGRSKRWLSTIVSQRQEPSTLSLLVISKNLTDCAPLFHKRSSKTHVKSIVSRIDNEIKNRIDGVVRLSELSEFL